MLTVAADTRRWAVSYASLDISSYDYLPHLYHDHGYEVIVDPVVYRIGELFLKQGTIRKGWQLLG
jgi:hypothetical protein